MRKFRNRLLRFSILGLVVHVRGFADDEVKLYEPDFNPVPPSPQVEALISLQDIDVDYFRGRPSVSVPIYTVRSGDLEIPITLDYVGGGKRLDAEAGSVGYDWVLSASAVISRSLNGHPDEMTEGPVRGLFKLTDDIILRNFVRNREPIGYNPANFKYFQDSLPILSLYGVRYYYGKSDMANDLFQLSGCGLSGTFGYGDIGLNYRSISLSSPQWLSISPEKVWGTYLNEFIVTDSEGTAYTFDERELAQYMTQYGNPEMDNSVESTSNCKINQLI